MKKMLLATALALLITGYVLNRRFTVQNKPAAVAPKTKRPSFLRFWNLSEEDISAMEICGSAKILLKQKPSKHS